MWCAQPERRIQGCYSASAAFREVDLTGDPWTSLNSVLKPFAPGPGTSPTDIEELIRQVPVWRHRIPVADIVTPGTEDTFAELKRLNLPADLTGKRVLDVGCSDGLYSFESERRGASSVVAIDDESSLLAGGVNGFQVAHKILNSSVDYRTRDVEELNVDEDGTFDLVLFINVLYHLKNPIRSLEAIRGVTATGGQMILKSYFQTDVRKWYRGRCYGFDIDRRPKMWFYPSRELSGDPTNWFGPNRAALEGLLGATGWSYERQLRWGDRLYYLCTAR